MDLRVPFPYNMRTLLDFQVDQVKQALCLGYSVASNGTSLSLLKAEERDREAPQNIRIISRSVHEQLAVSSANS